MRLGNQQVNERTPLNVGSRRGSYGVAFSNRPGRRDYTEGLGQLLDHTTHESQGLQSQGNDPVLDAFDSMSSALRRFEQEDRSHVRFNLGIKRRYKALCSRLAPLKQHWETWRQDMALAPADLEADAAIIQAIGRAAVIDFGYVEKDVAKTVTRFGDIQAEPYIPSLGVRGLGPVSCTWYAAREAQKFGAKVVPRDARNVLREFMESENMEAIPRPTGQEGSRLRPRGKLTRQAEASLSGLLADFCKDGGKTSPASVGGWFRYTFGRQARLIGLKLVCGMADADAAPSEGEDGKSKPEPEGKTTDVLASVAVKGRAEVLQVSIALVCRLVNYMAYRPRHTGTPLLLRTKAAQYSKELGFGAEHLAVVIHGSIVLAMIVPEPERRSWKSLNSSAGERIISWSERLTEGLLADRTFSLKVLEWMGWSTRWATWVGVPLFVVAKLGAFTWLGYQLSLALVRFIVWLLGFGIDLVEWWASLVLPGWLLPLVIAVPLVLLVGSMATWLRPRARLNLSPA